MKEQVTTLDQLLTETRYQLASETAAKNAALEHAHALQEELNTVRRDSAQHLESLRQEQERQATEFQQTITARDTAFRAELGTATQRLESAQAQMLQQIDDARKEQRHAQIHSRALEQQRDQLQSELAELKLEFGLKTHELKRTGSALEKSTEAANQWAAERQTLMTALARSEGRAESLKESVRNIEMRAVAAEKRLAEVLAQSDPKPAPRPGRRGKGP